MATIRIQNIYFRENYFAQKMGDNFFSLKQNDGWGEK